MITTGFGQKIEEVWCEKKRRRCAGQAAGKKKKASSLVHTDYVS